MEQSVMVKLIGILMVASIILGMAAFMVGLQTQLTVTADMNTLKNDNQYFAQYIQANSTALKNIDIITKYCEFKNDVNNYVHIADCLIPVKVFD